MANGAHGQTLTSSASQGHGMLASKKDTDKYERIQHEFPARRAGTMRPGASAGDGSMA